MKKVIFGLLTIMIIAASCKKDHQPVVRANLLSAKKYPVLFTVSQFTQSTGSIYQKRSLTSLIQKNNLVTAADTSVLNQNFEYFYLIYDSNGTEIKRIIRNSFSPGYETVYQFVDGDPVREISTRPDSDPFNVITDSLAAGTYTVVVTGCTNAQIEELEIDYSDGNYSRESPVYSPYSTATVFPGQGLDNIPRSVDIFFGKCTLTVTGPTKSDAITLNRIVGEVEVDLTDAVIPSNVSYIILGRSGELNGYAIANETPNTPTDQEADPPETLDNNFSYLTGADYTRGTYIMQRYVLNTLSPIDVVINAYDSNGIIIASKTVPQVQIQKNRRTILTGKLFDNSVTAQFTINANAAWGPDTPPISFKRR